MIGTEGVLPKVDPNLLKKLFTGHHNHRQPLHCCRDMYLVHLSTQLSIMQLHILLYYIPRFINERHEFG